MSFFSDKVIQRLGEKLINVKTLQSIHCFPTNISEF